MVSQICTISWKTKKVPMLADMVPEKVLNFGFVFLFYRFCFCLIAFSFSSDILFKSAISFYLLEHLL